METHTTSRQGGKASSDAKARLDRSRVAPRAVKVQDGAVRALRRCQESPPPLEKIAEILTPYCKEKGITRLEIFGSVARGQARPGSDVDLIATFDPTRMPHGLRYFAVADEMAALLGVSVDLLTPEEIAEITNSFRKNAILAEAREILSFEVSPPREKP